MRIQRAALISKISSACLFVGIDEKDLPSGTSAHHSKIGSDSALARTTFDAADDEDHGLGFQAAGTLAPS